MGSGIEVFQGALEKVEVVVPAMDSHLKIDGLNLKSGDFYRHSSASNHGGVTINDGEMAERQKSFISRTLKTVGSKFFEGTYGCRVANRRNPVQSSEWLNEWHFPQVSRLLSFRYM